MRVRSVTTIRQGTTAMKAATGVTNTNGPPIRQIAKNLGG